MGNFQTAQPVFQTDISGNPLPIGGLDFAWAANIAVTTATSTLLKAAVTGRRLAVRSFSVSNKGASASLISLTDGDGGTVLWRLLAPVGGGRDIVFPTPLLLTAATALYAVTSDASTTLYISAAGDSIVPI